MKSKSEKIVKNLVKQKEFEKANEEEKIFQNYLKLLGVKVHITNELLVPNKIMQIIIEDIKGDEEVAR